MQRFIPLVMACSLALTAPAAAAAQEPDAPQQRDQAQANVPVRAVVLFSSGVGYFEHFGTVNGQGTTELRFQTEQINDILKSLLLQDLDGGTVGTVTYPSHDPVERTLKSFQVDLTGNPPLADLLNQLRGAQVTVSMHADQLTGTILGVEKQRRPVNDKDIIEVHVLNLIANASIRALPLDEIRDIRLEDPRLQEELSLALAALAQARDQDKKQVQINFLGEGERRVRVGYVVEAPVWKTSYRLVLPAGEGDAMLQGWAIVENQTDNDWNNVQLSLVSGRPISFIQDLYQPLYMPRPVVVPELFAGLRPRLHDPGLAPAEEQRVRREGLLQRDGRAPAADMFFEDAASRRGGEGLPAQPLDPAASVAGLASAAQIGELFQYTVGNVSLPRQTSAMIPIITDDVQIERLSIYNQGVLARHPLNGLRLTNTTEKHLLQGPVTVLEDGGYAGDARIDNLPPDQHRLLSYGIDLQMLVDASRQREQSHLVSGRIVRGVLHLTRRSVFTQGYIAENRSDRERTLLIEHPVRRGWELVETPDPVETTDEVHRFSTAIPSGEQQTFTVQQQRVHGETIAILPADIGQLVQYTRSGQIPREVRDALAEAIRMKRQMVETERQIEHRRKQVAEITQEQGRIRENMRAVDRNSDYYNRLLGKLNEQETEIEQFRKEMDELQEAFERQRNELEAYLSNLSVG